MLVDETAFPPLIRISMSSPKGWPIRAQKLESSPSWADEAHKENFLKPEIGCIGPNLGPNGWHSRWITELVRVNLRALLIPLYSRNHSRKSRPASEAVNFPATDPGFRIAESMVEGDESPAASPELKQVTCSMVVIRDKCDWNVFPPVNHENLQVLPSLSREDGDEEERNTPSSFSPPSSDVLSSASNSSITSCSSTSSFPPLEDGDAAGLEDTKPSDSTIQVREVGYVSGWWMFWFGILRSKMRAIIWCPLGCGNTARARTFWLYVPTAVTMMLGLLYWQFRPWRWWSRRETAEERLTSLIKEKDQVGGIRSSTVWGNALLQLITESLS